MDKAIFLLNFSQAVSKKSILSTAAVPNITLSIPKSNNFSIRSNDLTPPPT